MRQFQFLLLMVHACACSFKSEDDRFYEKSAAIHFAMVAQANEMKAHLHDCIMKSPAVAPADSLTALLSAIEQWEQDLVEVPGYNHHAEGSGHTHNHEPPPEVTAQQMLHIQQALELRLNEINKRLKRLTRYNETI